MAAATNPFPGMNPYLEWNWGDVHHRLVQYAADALNEVLPSGLFSRVEERLYVETDVYDRPVVPDARIVEVRRPWTVGTAVAEPSSKGVATEPVRLRFPSEPTTEGFIEVRDAKSDGRVVTLIEVVSEGSKRGGDGERKYKQKQREMRDAGANLVEIDLLREGRHVLAAPYGSVPDHLQTPYRVCVTRASKDDEVERYPIQLRERLPVIRIPLRLTDADTTLDIQSLLDDAYRKGRYDYIDYTKPPRPPLAGDDATWADELLKSKGLR